MPGVAVWVHRVAAWVRGVAAWVRGVAAWVRGVAASTPCVLLNSVAGAYLCARMAEDPTAECSAWPMELDGCQPDWAAGRGCVAGAGAAAQLWPCGCCCWYCCCGCCGCW